MAFTGFCPDNLALGWNWDISALRPQSGFEHCIFQEFGPSLVVFVHGRTEAHVGQSKGKLWPYGLLVFHQTYLSHVIDMMGGEEWSKYKCMMSV